MNTCKQQRIEVQSPEPPANDDLQLHVRPEEAIKFLTALKPDQDWCLASIAPYAGSVERSTRAMRFSPSDPERAIAWIQGQSDAQRGVYHVPAIFRDDWFGGDPPKLSDIVHSRLLWADIDPRPDEDFLTAQERIRQILTDGRPIDVPEPTGIISSGNGMQAYWLLKTSIDPEKLAAKNRWLASRLGGDEKTHNPNRMLRLPGTINYPSRTKLARGRKPQMARTINWDSSRSYDPAAFPEIASPARASSKPAEAGDNFRRIFNLDLDELPLAARVRATIVQGNDPLDPAKYKSRSEAQFYVSCELVRAGISDDIHYSILLDPDFLISAHVLDQTKPEKYAKRQIRRAKEAVEAPELSAMNEKHAVISSVGGKFMVARWIPSPLDPERKVMQLQSQTDFISSYSNVPAGDPKHPTSLGKWWLGQARRRQYDNIVFRPGEDQEVNGSFNLWSGFNIVPCPGDWSLLKAHIVSILANGNEEHAQYILNWCAWTLQNPHRPAEVALVFRGGRGVGKGRFAAVFKRIFGQHALQVSSSKHVAGHFNAHLRDTCFLFSDESYFPGAKSEEGNLKRLLTEDTIFIEAKGKDGEEHPNRLHIMMASNEEWVVPAGADERRFAVFQVSDAKQQEEGYFAALEGEVSSGGAEAFLFDMLNLDLGSWHPRRLPKSDALKEQKLLSLRPEEEWFLDLLQIGILPGSQERRPNVAAAKFLYDDARSRFPKLKDASDTRLGTILTKHGCRTAFGPLGRLRVFPPLREARKSFEDQHRFDVEWERPQLEDWQNPDDPPF